MILCKRPLLWRDRSNVHQIHIKYYTKVLQKIIKARLIFWKLFTRYLRNRHTRCIVCWDHHVELLRMMDEKLPVHLAGLTIVHVEMKAVITEIEISKCFFFSWCTIPKILFSSITLIKIRAIISCIYSVM